MARSRFSTTKAETWLRERLSDGEPHIAGMLIEAALQEGIKERTLQLARSNLRATTTYRNIEGTIAWYWQLPRTIEQEVQST